MRCLFFNDYYLLLCIFFFLLIMKLFEIGKVGYILDFGYFYNDVILELGKNIIRISICGYIE